jgi:hypothetical protein
MNVLKAAVIAAGVLGSQTASAGFIDSSNRDWLQLTNTFAVNVSSFLSVCNATTGACNGSVRDYVSGQPLSLTGYTWATMAEVRSLFASRGVVSTQTGNLWGPGTSQTFNFSAAVGAEWIDTDGSGPDTGAFYCTPTCTSTQGTITGAARPQTVGTVFGGPLLTFTLTTGSVAAAYYLNSPASFINVTNVTGTGASFAAGYFLYKVGPTVETPPPNPTPPPGPVIDPPPAEVPLPSTSFLLLFGGLLSVNGARVRRLFSANRLAV